MATTVNSAFAEFLGRTVNLDPDETQTARRSRDWLLGQIGGLTGADPGVPALYDEQHIHYGSFARNTKVRPLDDIDMMVCLRAQGCTYRDEGGEVRLTVPSTTSDLKRLTFDDGVTLNSRKVINRFVSALSAVPQYGKATIKRNGEAATLKLVSYDWAFDVTPCFLTAPEVSGRSFYLVPDGDGHWKRTDPRIDRDRVRRINQAHEGRVLNIVRLAKYWNARPTAPRMPSYLLEALVLDHYNGTSGVTRYPDLEIRDVLAHISTAVLSRVEDPKRIDGDINALDLDQRGSIARKASDDVAICAEARTFEHEGDHERAIGAWQRVFGGSFPTYG